MIFIDASAMVSMIAGEPDAPDFARKIDTDASVASSAIAVWETSTALCRSYTFNAAAARDAVESLIKSLRIRYVNIGEPEMALALLAYETFGKRRHPAGLNMGDCFAYACARANKAKLLFKGDDFTLTDIEAA